jgi:hypothetical protein
MLGIGWRRILRPHTKAKTVQGEGWKSHGLNYPSEMDAHLFPESNACVKRLFNKA